MPTRRFNVSGKLDTFRGHFSRGPGSAGGDPSNILPLSEKEQQALLRAIPELVYRIEMGQDGAVSIVGSDTRTRITADALATPDIHADEEGDPEGLLTKLYEELARRSKELVATSTPTGEVRTFEVQLEQSGQETFYEVQATVCGSRQILAVVRDTTARMEAENAIARSSNELAHLNEMLQNEARLRAEEEQIIKNSFRKLEELLEDAIEAIALIIQKKHPQTARHQERVSRLACAVGREMGLPSSQVDVIGLAALLHDLGHVFIPADTLDKPGELSQEELSIVQNHAEAEFQVLKAIDLFLPIADIIHQHHERIDGSGYPLGLKGAEILMEARVIAVADVVEAMMSERPHRSALGLIAAIDEIKAGRGTLYDTTAVDACVKVFTEGKFNFDAEETAMPEGSPSRT